MLAVLSLSQYSIKGVSMVSVSCFWRFTQPVQELLIYCLDSTEDTVFHSWNDIT